MSFLVSGFEFHKLCKYAYYHRYTCKFIDNDLKEGDYVFLNLDYFHEFVKTLSKPINQFNLITHNSEKSFTAEHLKLINEYIIKIYPINCNFENDKIHKIPIGFVDNKYNPHIFFSNLMKNPPGKKILIYMNFDNTTSVESKNCFNYYSNFNWITKETKMAPEIFYKRLAESKYLLSPEGSGIDSNRIYESLYCNTIPIVKTSKLDDFYKNLPIVIVNCWEDVTEDFLSENYNKFIENIKKWKEENKDWCLASFWLEYK